MQFWTYKRELELNHDKLMQAIERTLASGQLILGAEVQAFEAEFAAYCKVENAVSVANGTDALELALRAMGLEQGDEVITVANAPVPTAQAIIAAGGCPVFADVHADTMLMDAAKVAAAVTERTRVILPVHLYGHCADMPAINAVAAKHNLKVLEDCAQAHGALCGEKLAGAMGTAAAFSFYPTKVLGAFGDGGMVTTNDGSIADNLRSLRYYGMEDEYYAERFGRNSRLDDVQAAILRTKLEYLEASIGKRRQVADRYSELLSGLPLEFPVEQAAYRHVYYAYVCRFKRRDELLTRLEADGVRLPVHFRWPLHTMRGFPQSNTPNLPVTEGLCQEIFSLPVYPEFSVAEQTELCDLIAQHVRALA